MMWKPLLLVSIALVHGELLTSRQLTSGSLYGVSTDSTSEGGWRLHPHTTGNGFGPEEAAYGQFNDTVESIGWATLSVHTNPQFNDTAATRAAGYLEGRLTAHRIYQHAVNSGYGPKYAPPPKLQKFVESNLKWLDEMQRLALGEPAGSADRSYWWQVGLIMEQLQGLTEGYKAGASPADQGLSWTQLLMVNLDGDMEDLAAALSEEKLSSMTVGDADSYVGGTRCSALLRLAEKNGDVFVAQETWSSLNSMLRIYKMYDFPFSTYGDLTGSRVPAQRSSFSSYPASLYSGDDFYQMSSGLVVQETTIGNSNPTLYRDFVSPMTVMEWTRNILANRMAGSAPEWAAIYRRFNSGTYNNQNMVFDMNRFTPGQPLENDTFWVVEQIPGHVVASDQSQVLQSQRHWASYNVAYDSTIRKLSGADASKAKYGDWFDYHKTARAQIFTAHQGTIEDMAGMQKMMRYNDFQNDPLSSQLSTCAYLHWTNCTPAFTAENAIACRDDLNPKQGVWALSAFGHRNHVATDAKITAHSLFNKGHLPTRTISGPTYDQQPVFVWSTSDFAETSHLGHPDRFEFPWVTIEF